MVEEVSLHRELPANVTADRLAAWKSLPEEQLPDLLPFLQAETAGVRGAALETLVQRAPHLLLGSLTALLASPELKLRALAIQGLSRIDPDEALLYLENMLTDPAVECRLAALKTAFLLPFEQSKPLLLKYLAIENEPELLKQAGLFFRINPDLAVPFRLWEIAEVSSREKARQLKESIQSACKALFDAGMLPESVQQFTARLQKWIQQRIAFKFVQDFLQRAALVDQDDRSELQAIFSASRDRPYFQETFQEALQWDISAELHSFLREILAQSVSPAAMSPLSSTPGTSATPATPTTPATPAPLPAAAPVAPTAPRPSHTPFGPTAPSESGLETARVQSSSLFPALSPFPGLNLEALSPKEQLLKMAAWPESQSSQARPLLQKLFERPDMDDSLTGSAFRGALRFEIRDFPLHAREALKKSHSGLVANAMDYLAFADPDSLFPLLGKYLKSRDTRVKTTAIKILKQVDLQTALSNLLAMLQSKEPAERQSAIHCLTHFDFPLIREPLCELIGTHPLLEFQKPLLRLFETNPDSENLYPLYRLQQLATGDFAAMVASTAKKNQELLIQLGRVSPASLPTLIADFPLRFQREQARKKAPPPTYAFKKPVSSGSSSATSMRECIEGLREVWQSHSLQLSALLIVGILLFGAAWFSRSFAPETALPLHRPKRLSGTILERISASEIRLQSDSRVFRLTLPEPNPRILPGKRFRLTLIPTKTAPNGEIIATLKSKMKELAHD